MEISRVNNTRVTVPKKVREYLSLKDGDYLAFEITPSGVTVKKVSFGSLNYV